jgi:DNA-binding NarL/FixJ family response regulator
MTEEIARDGQDAAAGWLFIDPDRVPEAWRERARSASYIPLLPDELEAMLRDGHAHPHIDGDEEQLLKLVASGLSNAEIGRQLGFGQRTVERRLTRIQKRLRVASKKELIEVLLSRGFTS